MSASAEEDSVPGSDCELHSVIEFQRIVLRQRHHNLISHAAKFALQPSSSTISPHHYSPSPTHSNPANLPSNLHSTPSTRLTLWNIYTTLRRHHSSKRSETTAKQERQSTGFFYGLILHIKSRWISKRINSDRNAMLDDCPFDYINCPRH
jgi:hypothetical protein